jgi:hypothetical protein
LPIITTYVGKVDEKGRNIAIKEADREIHIVTAEHSKHKRECVRSKFQRSL